MSSKDKGKSASGGMREAVNVDVKKTGRATFKKLVCPFDLNEIFSMQFNT